MNYQDVIDRFTQKFVVQSQAGTGMVRYTDADAIARFIVAELKNQRQQILEEFDFANKPDENNEIYL